MLCETKMENDSSSQLLMKLVQQQLLLSMFSRPELKITRELEGACEKRMSEPVEQREKPVGNRRRSEANARERNRVQHLGDMFDRLKSVLPIELDVKISKLATLRVWCFFDSSVLR
ncbi:Helix-loop-helix DNA-binding domain protein [Cooperia oncophora]